MKVISKIILLFSICIVAGFCFTTSGFAACTSDACKSLQGLDPALAGDIRNPPNVACLGVTVLAGLLEPNLSVLTCEVRCLFAGTLGYVIVATTVFINGILILAEKMSWQIAVLTSVLIILFLNAGTLANYITTSSGMFAGLFTVESNFTCNCTVYNLCPQI